MASRVAGRLLRHHHFLLLLLLALSEVLAQEGPPPDTSAGDPGPLDDPVPAQNEKPSSDVDVTPTSIGTYIAELFGTLAGLAWGLYASLPSFG